MTRKEIHYFIIAIVLLTIAALLPLTDSGYWISLGVTLAMYTVLSTSWALFSGPTRYISLASAGFFGVGMYIVGGFIEQLPLPLLVLLAALAGAVLATVIGLATLRISGVYFVIFTLGLSELIRQIMTWVQTTMGSSSGLYVLTDTTEPIIYWQLLLIAAIVYLTGWWITRSRLGFALRIIGNDELVAAHCGIDTARSKVILFVISGAFAALTGAVLAPRWTYVEPTMAFSPMISFQVAIMALLGGMHRLWGPILGVIPFTLLWEVISAKFPNQTTLLLGAAFLIIVYFIPDGVAGLLESTVQKRRLKLKVRNGT